MNKYRADLHVHTVLSPCGDLEMSPLNIINEAKKQELDIIGITDHNSTKNCRVVRELGEEKGIFVLCGAEITTKEEVHVLAFFEDFEKLNDFQEFLDEHLIPVENDADKFGHQVIVDRDENILGYEDKLLINALGQNIYQVEEKVHELQGLFIPAHIDRFRNSIISQMGFIPNDLNIDGIEISKHAKKDEFLLQNSYLKEYSLIQSSDAHFIDGLANVYTTFKLEKLSFEEISKAFKSIENREIIVR